MKLGVAGNDKPISQYHTVTRFDLSKVCMNSAKYVKLQDVSEKTPAVEGSATDGFDLNAVLALHDYKNKCNKYTEESAWAEGTQFSKKGNGGMYFTFQINEKESSCGKPYGGKKLFCKKSILLVEMAINQGQ